MYGIAPYTRECLHSYVCNNLVQETDFTYKIVNDYKNFPLPKVYTNAIVTFSKRVP